MWKELFGDKLNSKNGDLDTETALAGLDAVGIYFSAHWCPPCRGFTPVFATKFAELKAAGKKFECVFASSDSDQAGFDSYYADMPWFALPYTDRARKESLAKKFSCSGIPHLVILDGKTAEVITLGGRSGIDSATTVQDFPWIPKVLPEINSDMDGIDQGKCLILMQDLESPETQKSNEEWLTPFAEANKISKDFGRMFLCNGGGRTSFFRNQLGLESVVVPHQHELKQFTDFSLAYGHDSWQCDMCQKGPSGAVEQHHCGECQADYCKGCFEASKAPVPESAKHASFVVVNLSNETYYHPSEGKREVNAENFQALLVDMKADTLVKKALGEK